MIQSVKRRHNRENLVAACAALRSVAPFPFFGTLLGLTREGDVIKGDDDVDLYIDARDREVASTLLIGAGFEIVGEAWPNHTPYFLQATRVLGGTKTFVDIYCYENRPESPWIIDRWNFIGQTEKPEYHLCVDKDLVFPLEPKRILGAEILLPRRPAKCCRYLYGPTWRQKISKQKGGYSVVIHDNRPHILHRDSIANKLHLKGVARAAEIERLDGRLASLTVERDAITLERDQVLAERDALVGQRNHSAIECESMRDERDRMAAERDAVAGERDDAVAEREAMRVQRDAAIAERDAVEVQRDAMTVQRDEALAAQGRLTIEHDRAVAARDGMQRERDHAVAERDAMTTQRDHAWAERDAMVAQRDHAVAERDAMVARRDPGPIEAGKGMGRLFKTGNP